MGKLSVAVVGSGVSGLCAAWHLQRSGKCNVTLLEEQERFGGNACTVSIDGLDWDIGFLVYNNVTYPNLISLFEELGVETIESDMSFGFSNQSFEWASHDINSLLASRSNLVRPQFYQMISDMLRFNDEMTKFLKKYEEDTDVGPTLGEFCQERRYSDSFIYNYLIPMVASVWSKSHRDALNVPARFIFRFFENHRLAQIFDRPQWRTVKGGSKQYVQKICDDVAARGGELKTGARVTNVSRRGSQFKIQIDGEKGERKFDKLVLATDATTAASILGEAASKEEADLLSKFRFTSADLVIHRDASMMPKNRAAWSSWNFVRKQSKVDLDEPISVTYYNNRLQGKNHEGKSPPDTFETLNPTTPIPEELVLWRQRMSHPMYTKDTHTAQIKLAEMQGENGIYFCGAWTRYGFHEDGARSGFLAAEKITGVPVPWQSRLRVLELVEKREVIKKEKTTPWSILSATISRSIVDKFIDMSIRKGSFTMVDHIGESRVFGESPQEAESAGRPQSEMFVVSPEFYTRVANFADIGFAEAYMMRAIEFESHEKLLDLLKILILNRDNGNLNNSNLGSARWGTFFNDTIHKLMRRNTITGSRKNIAAHYDLSNDLFSTFLGESWTYSCGLWSEPSLPLDSAQYAKLDRLLSLAKVDSSCHILEIGCGWGEFAIYAAKTTGCKVTGITISEQQFELARERSKAANVSHLVDFQLTDYREVQGKYDRIVSIEMLEAVGHEFLGEFFVACENYLKPEGLVVVQVITTPEERYETYRSTSDFISAYIFPGGCCPSVNALLDAMAKNSNMNLEQLDNFAPDYARTLREWRIRFNENLDRVYELGFDELFVRMWNYYLLYCEAGFATRTLGLHQIVFSRTSNTGTLGGTPLAPQS